MKKVILKGIKIDVEKKDIYYVDVEKGLKAMYATIGCSLVEGISLTTKEHLWIDEEGLLNSNPKGAFKFDRFPQVLSGNGLILGLSRAGNSCNTGLTVDQVKALVEFVDVDQLPDPSIMVVAWKPDEHNY